MSNCSGVTCSRCAFYVEVFFAKYQNQLHVKCIKAVIYIKSVRQVGHENAVIALSQALFKL